MIKILTNNIGLKILALLFAIALWLIVLNIDDPELTKSFVVQVTMENTEVLDDANMTYEVLDDTDTVRVTVTAKRTIIDNLSASDFQAVADFSDLDEDSLEGEHELQIYVSALRYSNQVAISSRTKALEINVEQEISKELMVNTSYTGTPADGYQVKSITALPEKVTVTGPESVVSQIAMAGVSVDVTSMSTDVTVDASLILYKDQDMQTVLTSDRLTISANTIKVSIGFSQEKSVSLTFETKGTPAKGYEVVNVTGDVSQISISGSSEDLEKCEYISISGDDLNIDGAASTITKVIKLADYLPDGITLADGEVDKVTVTIDIKPYSEKDIMIATGDIDVTGLADGYEYTFTQSVVTVTVAAAEDVIDTITTDDIKASISLEGYDEGTHTVQVSAELPDGVTISGNLSTEVTITKTADDDDDDDNNTEE